MHPDTPSKYVNEKIGQLYTYLDMKFIIRWVLQNLPLAKRTNPWILDVGAGKGRMTRQFVSIAEKCVAIEPFFEFYKTLVANCTSPNLEICNLSLLEYQKTTEDRFDIIFIGGVFSYLDNQEVIEAMICVRNLLRPWGLVCIRDYGSEGQAYRPTTEIRRTPREIEQIAMRTGFVCLCWRRAYPIHIPWILYNRWPNSVTKLLWNITSRRSFLPVWHVLNRLNMPHRNVSFFHYLMQQDHSPKGS